jgi:hypothetical protein
MPMPGESGYPRQSLLSPAVPAGYGAGTNTITVRSKKRRHPDSNRGIKVLQTSALPLGYGA